jgi:hypothetical protein
MEARRLQVTAEDIAAYFERLAEAFESVPAHFVYNIDEMGRQEWADRQERMYYASRSHSDTQVYFSVP